MAHSKQRIAIARILSDLIKSDNIIEKEEIEQYNKVIDIFNIKPEELIAAQDITLTTAMNDIKDITNDDQEQLYKSLLVTANADNACVAREALILLTLQLVLEDKNNKYELLSYDTHGSYTNDKYVIYLESDEIELINEDISKEYDHIVNLLKLWKFDFIYLPKVAERFANMGKEYLLDIIKYMNPRLNDIQRDQLYTKLTTIDTHSFVTDLSNDRGQEKLRNTEPALLINIGTSVVPYCQQDEEGHTYTEFLKISLDNEPNCVLEEVRRFLTRYQEIITEPEYYRPDRNKDYFKYFGFYKMLFDFFSRIENNGYDNDIIINLGNRSIYMQGKEVKLTGTELGVYMLILQQTHCNYRNGLLKVSANRQLTPKDDKQITEALKRVMSYCRDEKYIQSYSQDFENIKSYISKIKKKIKNQIRSNRDLGHFLPTENKELGVYQVTINPSKVFIKQFDGNLVNITEFDVL